MNISKGKEILYKESIAFIYYFILTIHFYISSKIVVTRHYEILRNRDYRSNQQDDSENLKFSNNTKFQDSQDQLKISEPSASVPQPEESKQKTVKEMYESITPKLVIICHWCGKVNHTSFQWTSDPLPENQLISVKLLF